MQKDIRVLITDYHCASNRGDAAILEGVITSLRKHFPSVEVTVLTAYPEAAQIINRVNSVKQKMVPFRWGNVGKNIAALYLLLGAWLFRQKINVPGMKMLVRQLSLESYLNANFVISTGGSFLNDFYAPSNLGRFWGLYFARLLGKPVVIYAQSIGPLNKLFYRQVARFILNRVSLITLRDKKSKQVLNELDVVKPPIHVTSDAAFAIDLDSKKGLRTERLEKPPLISTKHLAVSISVRKWFHYEDPRGHENYLDVIAKTADWLISKQKAQVVFASTCTGLAGYHHDDRISAREVISRMKYATDRNPTILYGEYSPYELAHFYGKMDLHIGTRMHSNLLAILAGTPIVAIKYEFKTAGLMGLFGLGEFVEDINGITGDSLIRLIEKALQQRSYIKNQISSNLANTRRKAEEPAKLIVDLVYPKKAVGK